MSTARMRAHIGSLVRLALVLAAVVSAGAITGRAQAGTTVSEIARIQGQGQSVLRGIGLVVGLNGTGDSGKDLVLARPLMEVYRNNGNPVLVDDLKNAKTVAIVTVLCTVPESGARTDDRFDITVSAMHSATSLAGGTLYLAPLQGPFPGDPVYAIAEGMVVVESEAQPRTGRVRGGARMIRDIRTGTVGDSFTIVLRPAYEGHAAASEVASAITQSIYGKAGRSLGNLPAVATAIDNRSIRVEIPEAERANAPAFVGDVMSTPINTALLKLPAQVIYNSASQSILVTGDVEISPVAITQADLTITTTVPAPTPTADNPLVQTNRWMGLSAGAKETERAKVQDLLNAFNQLKIPVKEQIAILSMLEKAGKLHGRLIID